MICHRLSVPTPGWPLLLSASVLLLLALAVALPAAGATPEPPEERQAVPRGGGSSSPPSARPSRSPEPARATPPRSAGRQGSARRSRPSGGDDGERTVVPRRRTPPPGDRKGHLPRFRSHRFGGHLGFYHFYYPFLYPRYSVGYGGSYGPRWYGYRASSDLGGADLNVKPKKAEVYLDGQSIGRVDAFDGFPGKLWLEEGTYDLVFYREGYQTLYRELTVYPGLVIDVNARMVRGEAEPPEALLPERPATHGGVGEARRPADSQVEPGRRRAERRYDPARLYLTIEPADASVYLDGRFLGTGAELGTLRAGLMVNPGEHRLSVIHPRLAAEEVRLDVAAGEELDVAVTLQPPDDGA